MSSLQADHGIECNDCAEFDTSARDSLMEGHLPFFENCPREGSIFAGRESCRLTICCEFVLSLWAFTRMREELGKRAIGRSVCGLGAVPSGSTIALQ